MVECNCNFFFSRLVFHRQGKMLGREVYMDPWKSSRETP